MSQSNIISFFYKKKKTKDFIKNNYISIISLKKYIFYTLLQVYIITFEYYLLSKLKIIHKFYELFIIIHYFI